MIITEKTSIMFTLPQDDERLKMFVTSQDMSKWKRERMAPNIICYSQLKVKRTTETKEEKMDA